LQVWREFYSGAVTVLEVIQRSTEYLARKGVDSPRLQIELLLAHVLGLPRLSLYLNFDRKLVPGELEALRELVRRRGNREPLQHLLGTACFCGFELVVGPAVLAPRPETELLAEQGWEWLSQRERRPEVSQPLAALDYGTGSGCLAIALAAKCPSVEVVAVDISEAALEVARQNAARHGVAARIQFLCGDGFGPVPAQARFDLLVANPPYVPSGELAHLQPEVRDYDPRCALDGGPDGLLFLRRLAHESAAFLRPHGVFMAEFGDGQAQSVRAIFVEAGWQVDALRDDYSGRPRILIARPIEP
jgi:release factor glutamine methyltransferase